MASLDQRLDAGAGEIAYPLREESVHALSVIGFRRGDFMGFWQMRALKFLVVAMGVLIVAGTVTLVVLIVQRAGGGSGASLPPMSLNLPAGSRIMGIAGAKDHFAVHVQRPDGDRILLLDPRSGRVVGEVIPGAAVPVQ
jgi:hypothetical protein